jgi:hypothetical protein
VKYSNKCHVIVVGAQKAGTTWLHNTLEYQNEFWCPANLQETHFFDRYYEYGYKWYESLYKGARKSQITFDVTPAYLCNPLVPKRIISYENISKRNIKIIIILRDPVNRAISAYKMKVNKGAYNLVLSEALKVDTSLIVKSRYLEPLTKYKKLFDESCIRVFIMEEVFGRLCDFLCRVRQFVQAEEPLVNPYGGVRVNAASEGKSYYFARVVSNALRRLGFERVVHKVKRSRWARYLRRDPSQENTPVIDDDGVQRLHEELSNEAKEVLDLLDRQDILDLWNIS